MKQLNLVALCAALCLLAAGTVFAAGSSPTQELSLGEPAPTCAAAPVPEGVREPLRLDVCSQCSIKGATKWEREEDCCRKISGTTQRWRQYRCDGDCWTYTTTTKCEDACGISPARLD